jgi:mono/diheme cytochrome c family protein
MPHLLRNCRGLLLLAGWLLSVSSAGAEPFVAGFDRYGQHGDLPVSLAGELLLTELNCRSCHRSQQPAVIPSSAPLLTGVGTRIAKGWLEQYLLDPQGTKPGSRMPALLDHLPSEQRVQAARELTAFLLTLEEPFPEIKGSGLVPVPHEFWNRGDQTRGRQLYHQLGCAACHAPDDTYEIGAVTPSPYDLLLQQLDPEELAELGLTAAVRPVASVPLPLLGEKYTAEALTHFLLNPHRSRPAGRMPDFQLAPVDAADLAAYLRSWRSAAATAPEEVTEKHRPAPTEVEAGRVLFSELRCQQCHQLPGGSERGVAQPFSQLDPQAETSCLHPGAANLPRYQLSAEQRAALVLVLSQPAAELSHPETLTLQLVTWNCLACHERDGWGGVGQNRRDYFQTVGRIDLGDEGRLPPPLSGVGRKLRTAALQGALNGSIRIRPHMTIRMPVFDRAAIQSLPAAFQQVDGPVAEVASNQVFAQHDKATLLAAGRELMDSGCVQCHQFNGEVLPGTVGVDLAGVSKRVHPGWLKEFLLNPTALKPRTRMPTFFPDGRSANQEVLGGDRELQLAAIWEYLADLERQPLPQKILDARAQNFELTPTERPIVQRTFFTGAGQRAIVVGFPAGVHFAFDAERLQPALAWRGRFMDAQGTWFVRSAPPADPLGVDLLRFPAGPIMVKFSRSEEATGEMAAATLPGQFRGYRLDEEGVPEFEYELAGIKVSDRLTPDGSRSLVRRIRLQTTSIPAGLCLLLAESESAGELQFDADTRTGRLSSGWSIQLEPGSGESEIRKTGDHDQWILPLTPESPGNFREIVIRYSWTERAAGGPS